MHICKPPTTTQIAAKVNGLLLENAHHALVGILGAYLGRQMYLTTFSVCYAVLEHPEICNVTLTVKDLNSFTVEATFCFL